MMFTKYDEGDKERIEPSEYDGYIFDLVRLARRQEDFENGDLENGADRFSSEVIQRAKDEGAKVARLEVPYWLQKEADGNISGKNNLAFVKEYSEDAFQVIGFLRSLGRSGFSAGWVWEFLPKSQVEIIVVEDVEESIEVVEEVYSKKLKEEAGSFDEVVEEEMESVDEMTV